MRALEDSQQGRMEVKKGAGTSWSQPQAYWNRRDAYSVLRLRIQPTRPMPRLPSNKAPGAGIGAEVAEVVIAKVQGVAGQTVPAESWKSQIAPSVSWLNGPVSGPKLSKKDAEMLLSQLYAGNMMWGGAGLRLSSNRLATLLNKAEFMLMPMLA